MGSFVVEERGGVGVGFIILKVKGFVKAIYLLMSFILIVLLTTFCNPQTGQLPFVSQSFSSLL